MKELRDGVLIILALTILFLIGAGLIGSSSMLVSGLGAVAVFGLIFLLGGVLRVAFAGFRRKCND